MNPPLPSSSLQKSPVLLVSASLPSCKVIYSLQYLHAITTLGIVATIKNLLCFWGKETLLSAGRCDLRQTKRPLRAPSAQCGTTYWTDLIRRSQSVILKQRRIIVKSCSPKSDFVFWVASIRQSKCLATSLKPSQPSKPVFLSYPLIWDHHMSVS